MKISFDTNILAYLEGFGDDIRTRQAEALLEAVLPFDLIMPVQVSAELAHLMIRKFGKTPEAALIDVGKWQNVCTIRPATSDLTFSLAGHLMEAHRLQVFDAMILAASAEAGATMLLSEDMQDGFVWRGCTVVNPFRPEPHPLLADLLGRTD